MEPRDKLACDAEAPRVTGLREAGGESAKIMAGRRGGIGIGDQVSYIENSPEKSVVLSPRLQQLIRDVGGCQTEQVEAMVRRVMYELLSR